MKLSIITINYNNAAGLKKTLDSVAAQTSTDFEHIIVDGASMDGSVEIIRQYADSQAIRRRGDEAMRQITWLSEPDTGIYNAMNKGVRMANGEYTLMLNSGDYLVDEYVVEQIIPLLDGTDIIQGNTISIIDEKNIINRGYGKSDISFIDVYNGHFLHQASFTKRILFEQYGYFDEKYKIGGDTVFFLKTLGFGNASFAYRDMNIAYFDTNGISTNHTPYWNDQRAIEDQMYDDLLSYRLLQLCKEDGYKIDVFNLISSHWLLKKCMTILFRLAKIFN